MSRYFFFFLLFLSSNMMAQSSFAPHTYINEKGDSLLYQLLKPFKQEGKKYPLVVFLHGAGERGNDNQKQLVNGSFLFLNESNQQKFPAYVLFPQCPEQGYWSSMKVDRTPRPHAFDFNYTRPTTQSLALVMQLIKELQQNESIDKSRIYIAGLSMGGMGTFEAVYKYPDVFAAAIAICGGGDLKSYAANTPNVPFRVFHGATDDVVGVDNSRNMVEVLKSKNKKVLYTEYPNANHNSWDSAFAETDFLSWLFSHKK